jgi:predicted DNA-binding transcriptional regulator AlpA
MKTKRIHEDRLKSGPNIARALDLDPATIRRYARDGMPHHVLADRVVRYRMSEVLDWLAQRKRSTPKAAAGREAGSK